MSNKSICGIRRLSKLMKTLACSALLAPLLAFAAPVVMVDGVPSAAQLVNYSTIQVPYRDLKKADAKAVEQGISSVIAQMREFAEQNGATHICLFSSAAAKTRSFKVEAAKSRIRLTIKDAELIVVLYRNAADSPAKVTFLTEKPKKKENAQSIRIKWVSGPEDWPLAAWVYFNLPRIQNDALKAGATQVFLTATGMGAKSAVVIPGAREPLQMYEKEAEIEATWYVPGK